MSHGLNLEYLNEVRVRDARSQSALSETPPPGPLGTDQDHEDSQVELEVQPA